LNNQKTTNNESAHNSNAANCYVAILDHTDQVGFEQSQTFREAKPLTGTETISELIAWGEKWIKQPQIVIVLAT